MALPARRAAKAKILVKCIFEVLLGISNFNGGND